MSNIEDLQKKRQDLQSKMEQTEGMIGQSLSWKDAQFYIEKYKEDIRVLDNKIAKMQLGLDLSSELKDKKMQLQEKLQTLEQMRKTGEISDKVYKEKRKDIEKEIAQAERDIVDTM